MEWIHLSRAIGILGVVKERDWNFPQDIAGQSRKTTRQNYPDSQLINNNCRSPIRTIQRDKRGKTQVIIPLENNPSRLEFSGQFRVKRDLDIFLHNRVEPVFR